MGILQLSMYLHMKDIWKEKFGKLNLVNVAEFARHAKFAKCRYNFIVKSILVMFYIYLSIIHISCYVITVYFINITMYLVKFSVKTHSI